MGMLKEKTAPAECGLPLPLDGDDDEAALDRDEEGVSPPPVSMTRLDSVVTTGRCWCFRLCLAASPLLGHRS